jgi:hypothetical protein
MFVGFELLDTGDKGVWGKRVLIVYLCTLALIKFSFLVPITSVPTLLEQIQLISRQGPNVIGDDVVK